jgi:hypothetical protein
MGKDNQPKDRQKARDLRRRTAVRQAYARVLIVCEGEKTEPQYLNEIRTQLRLATAHVQVQPGGFGTEPQRLVGYAEHLVRKGDRALGVEPGAFDHVYVVFDRDEHQTYHQALEMTRALDGRLRNDEHRAIAMEAVVSVPCFELWLLLHFDDVRAPLHRDETLERLKRHLPGYAKGQGGHWFTTKDRLESATKRAAARAAATNAYDGHEPYTDMHRLVQVLLRLKN